MGYTLISYFPCFLTIEPTITPGSFRVLCVYIWQYGLTQKLCRQKFLNNSATLQFLIFYIRKIVPPGGNSTFPVKSPWRCQLHPHSTRPKAQTFPQFYFYRHAWTQWTTMDEFNVVYTQLTVWHSSSALLICLFLNFISNPHVFTLADLSTGLTHWNFDPAWLCHSLFISYPIYRSSSIHYLLNSLL